MICVANHLKGDNEVRRKQKLKQEAEKAHLLINRWIKRKSLPTKLESLLTSDVPLFLKNTSQPAIELEDQNIQPIDNWEKEQIHDHTLPPSIPSSYLDTDIPGSHRREEQPVAHYIFKPALPDTAEFECNGSS